MIDAPRTKTNRHLAAAICGLLLLTVAVVFGRTAQYEFVNYDDDKYVYENLHVAHGLTAKTVAWSFTTFQADNWHPLTWLSHAMDCQLYGAERAGGHHLTNVALHAAVAILLFLVLWQMTGNLWPSAIVAAVFALHPLRVESVAWVAERKDLLSSLFFMLTLAAYLGYVRHPFSRGRYLLVAASFGLGLLAKPMLVTLPFVLLLLDYWPLGRFRFSGSAGKSDPPWHGDRTETPAAEPLPKQPLASQPTWRRLIAEKIPLAALAAASCVVTVFAQRDAIATLTKTPIWSRIANALVSYVAYINELFYPVGLAVFYPHPKENLPIWKIVGALLVLGGVSAAAWIGRKRAPYLLVGWLWYLGMLVPVIGLMQVGDQAMADRYTYLPQIGLVIAMAWGAANVAVAWPYRRLAYGTASVLLVAALMACSWRQTSFWSDSETLWTRALDCTSGNALAHNNLGTALERDISLDAAVADGRVAKRLSPNVEASHRTGGAGSGAGEQSDKATIADRKAASLYLEAIAHYQKALEIRPGFYLAHYNIGNALAACGQGDRAIAEFRTALKSQANYAPAHNNLGNILFSQGRNNEAIAEYRKAIELNPDSANAHNNLGVILSRRGDLAAAIPQLQKAVEIKPDFVTAHDNLATALKNSGDIADAIHQWREVVRFQPGNLHAVNELAWALATRPGSSDRKGAEAVELAEWAVRLSRGREPIALNTLAAAYAKAGRFADATRAAHAALGLATRQDNQELATSIQAKIALYEANKPYIDPIGPSPAAVTSSEHGKIH